MKGVSNPGAYIRHAAGIAAPKSKSKPIAKSKPPRLKRPRPDLSWASVRAFLEKDPGPDSLAGVANRPLIQHCMMATAADFEGRRCTEHQYIGRFWERFLLYVPDVQRHLGKHLTGSLDLLGFFLDEIHVGEGGTGFFDANGKNRPVSKAQREALAKQIERIGKLQSTHPYTLAKAGVVYADRFTINGTDFVDGAFLLPVNGAWIVLLRVEAKTIGSPGVDAQLGAFFVRLASSAPDDAIECTIDGQKKKLSRNRLLFNPTATDSGVGVQQWWARDYVQADVRRPDAPALEGPSGFKGKSFNERSRSAARNAGRRGITTEFDVTPDNARSLSSLAVSGDVVYSKANLEPLRAWMRRLAQARPQP